MDTFCCIARSPATQASNALWVSKSQMFGKFGTSNCTPWLALLSSVLPFPGFFSRPCSRNTRFCHQQTGEKVTIAEMSSTVVSSDTQHNTVLQDRLHAIRHTSSCLELLWNEKSQQKEVTVKAFMAVTNIKSTVFWDEYTASYLEIQHSLNLILLFRALCL